MMAMRTDLIPEAGSYDYIKVNLPNYKKQQPKFEVIDFQYGKDYDEPTGEGTLNLVYDQEVYNALLKYSEIMITVGWHYSSYTIDSEIFKGFIKDISYEKDQIKIELADKGIMLEQSGDVNFTKKKRSKIMEEIIKQAGLKPYVDFHGVEDKEMDYTSTSTVAGTAEGSATAGSVSGTGKTSCGNCSRTHPYSKWYATTVQNYCPACGKSNTIVYARATGGKSPCPNSKFGADDNPIAEGHYFCCNCDADFCVVCGTDHGRYSRRLTIVAGPTEVSGPTDSAEGGETTSSQNKTYWDMLVELADPANLDLQMYVWSDYCIVEPVPDPQEADLFVDSAKNVFEDSVKVKEGDAMLTNNIIVNYGQGKTPNSIHIQEDRLVEKYGKTEPKKYNKPKMNAEEATIFARKEMNRLLRDSGFQIELDTFGHPSYYIGAWVKTDLHRYDVHDNYYISKFSIEGGAEQILKSAIMLLEYRPTLTLEKNAQTSNNIGNLDGIMKEAAKFRYSHSCSEAACLQATGQGDCWAHSDWIYARLVQAGIRARILQYRTSASPRHRSVQIYQNGAWVDVPYRQYNVNTLFRATTNKPGAFVYKGG
jgi:hypothetical protein